MSNIRQYAKNTERDRKMKGKTKEQKKKEAKKKEQKVYISKKQRSKYKENDIILYDIIS